MGLTLLELLLVIVIIGLLLAMMMPATRQVREADGRAGVGIVNTILPFNGPSFQVQGSPTADGVYSAGSMHPGGGNVVLLDGSTHFVSEDIDTGDMSAATLTVEQMAAYAPTPYGVWGAAGTIRSGEVFSGFN